MGQNISNSRFTEQDFLQFEERLLEETRLLESWFEQNRFSESPAVGGFELEAWLIDAEGNPSPKNGPFLESLRDAHVVPELAKFNIELNTPPRRLHGRALSTMEGHLQENWTRCVQAARRLGLDLMTIGILPTLHDRHLTLANMSSQERYRALNEQVLHLRQQRPITLDIEQEDHLFAVHGDVMLEAAATSFQIHLQVPASRAAVYYNAAILASGPMVALTSNSPFLFGASLWQETRIPLFEQSVSVAPRRSRQPRRVTFGGDFLHSSLMECFRENIGAYAVLLPMLLDEPPERLAHLRLHNGTIWRWNRPLLGFDDQGTPHTRIEHRVVAAGPTLRDMMADAAFYYGLVHALAQRERLACWDIAFAEARRNFYQAARYGLGASLTWHRRETLPASEMVLKHLLPLAREGLGLLALEGSDVEKYLGIIEARVRRGQTGADWQRRYMRKSGATRQGLTQAYRELQSQGRPVHEWPV